MKEPCIYYKKVLQSNVFWLSYGVIKNRLIAIRVFEFRAELKLINTTQAIDKNHFDRYFDIDT